MDTERVINNVRITGNINNAKAYCDQCRHSVGVDGATQSWDRVKKWAIAHECKEN